MTGSEGENILAKNTHGRGGGEMDKNALKRECREETLTLGGNPTIVSIDERVLLESNGVFFRCHFHVQWFWNWWYIQINRALFMRYLGGVSPSSWGHWEESRQAASEGSVMRPPQQQVWAMWGVTPIRKAALWVVSSNSKEVPARGLTQSICGVPTSSKWEPSERSRQQQVRSHLGGRPNSKWEHREGSRQKETEGPLKALPNRNWRPYKGQQQMRALWRITSHNKWGFREGSHPAASEGPVRTLYAIKLGFIKTFPSRKCTVHERFICAK